MPRPITPRKINPTGLVHLAIVYVIWGSTYLAIRIAVRNGFPPFALGATRILLAGSLLLLWGRLRGMRIRITKSEALTLSIAGLLLWPGANGLVSWAVQRADSSYAALLVAAVPIWMAVIDTILDRRWPSRRLAVSLSIGFLGVGLLSAPKLASAAATDAWAILALLAAPVSWAIGSSLQVRRPVGTTPLVSAGYLHLFGGAGFAVLWAFAGEPWPDPSWSAWGGWVFLVFIGSIVAFTSFVRILRLLPTGVAMTYAYVNPVVAVLLGWGFLHEPVTPVILGGMALILVGVWGVFREKDGRNAATVDGLSSERSRG